MKTYKVKDIMISFSEYTTVNQEATLFEAITALHRMKQLFEKHHDSHRSILVTNDNGRVVGKLSQHDLIMGLEDGYRKIGDLRSVAHMGYDPKFIRGMIEKNRLWEKPLDEICHKAGRIKIKDIMYTPAEGEFVEEDASLDIAIHQLGMGRHHSLLVTSKRRIVGVVRLSDIFDVVHQAVSECHDHGQAA